MPRAAAAGGSDCALPPHCERRACRWDRLTSPAVCHVAPARRPSLPESILQQRSQLRVLPTALRTPPVSRLIKTPKPREQRKALIRPALLPRRGPRHLLWTSVNKLEQVYAQRLRPAAFPAQVIPPARGGFSAAEAKLRLSEFRLPSHPVDLFFKLAWCRSRETAPRGREARLPGDPASTCVLHGVSVHSPLPGTNGRRHVMSYAASSPNSCVGVLTPSTSECPLIWR